MRTEREIIELAEDLLSHRFGGSQQLTDAKTLAGSSAATVIRARVASQPFLQQRSVVVKSVPATGDALDDAALLHEVAAYQFTTSLSEEVRPGPVLLAHDVEKRIIIITDSGDGDTFAELLEQEDPDLRQQILRNLGTALGRMHAGTAGREQQFTTLMSRLIKAHPELSDARDLRDRSVRPAVEMGIALVANSGIEVPEAVRSLAVVAEHNLGSTHARAFTPFDLSPDNIIVAERTEFLDYEWASFRDVSFDLACVIAGFPQFVAARLISDDEAEVFVKAWVHEVAHVWPDVTNEDYLHGKISAALVGWALSSIAMLHHGSLGEALHVFADPAEDETSTRTRLLRDRHQTPFTDEELLVRRDLYETFDALSRFTDVSRDPELAVVSAFARDVAGRVWEPRL